MHNWQDVWKRLVSGQHVVLRGAGAIPEPDPASLRLLRIDCEAFPEPRGVLDEACRRIDQLREAPHPIVDAAASRLRAGLRRHLLGESREDVEVARYLEVFERDVSDGRPRVALSLSGVDRADSVSLELFIRLIDGERALAWPMLLTFDYAEPTGLAKRLLDKLERSLPPDAFWSDPAPRGGEVPTSAPSLPSLTPATRRVLRAAATVGDRFESEVVAELLRLDELDVLGAVQEAVDQGLSITDRDQGIFRFDAGLGESLRQGTLPSLARAWHERLAQLFDGLPALHAPPPPAAAIPEAEPNAQPAAPSPAISPPAARTPSCDSREWFEGREDLPAAQLDPRTGPWWQRLEAELAAANTHAASDARVNPAGQPAAPAPQPAAPAPHLESPVRLRASEQRAATHAEAAGLWGAASEQHLAAAERASLTGQHPLALQYAGRALALAEHLDDRERRRRLQIMALLIVGRSRWQYHGAGEESSLQAALEPLLKCRSLMLEIDPPQLSAELGALIANVQYDIGTPQALERALAELTQASQILLAAGQPLDAARLLNDEAAVWVKLGDPVRANHLLSRSREVFSKVAGSYPGARVELLETEHLLARLLLHAPPRPGRERDALQLGVEHGRAAEEGYRDLNDGRQLGRVLETLGRLELRLDHVDVAARLLDDARQLQRQLGDGVGLARSSAALCDVLAQVRDYPRALELLAESITLNAEKGLRAGLELNLASLKGIAAQLPPGLHDAARALEQRLLRQLN